MVLQDGPASLRIASSLLVQRIAAETAHTDALRRHLTNIIRSVSLLQTDIFLAHAWAKDELGRDNHARAEELCRRLEGEGIKVWFDNDQVVPSNCFYGSLTLSPWARRKLILLQKCR